LTGAFSAAVFFGIGEAFNSVANSKENILLGLDNAKTAKDVASVLDSGFLTSAQQAGKVLAHAAAGGVMSTLNGGKFGHGFAAAGVTQAFSKSIDGIGNGAASHSGQRILAAAVLGGVTSAATGGKFANGAVTAAFSRAFNDESHWSKVKGGANALWDDIVNGNSDGYWGFVDEEGLNVLLRTGAVIGGAGQVALGAGICYGSGGLACVGGAYIGSHGLNNIYEGFSGNDGLVRQAYKGILGEKTGQIAYGVIDIGTSISASSTAVLKPDSWKLFRYIPEDYVRGVSTMTNAQVVRESTLVIGTVIDTANGVN